MIQQRCESIVFLDTNGTLIPAVPDNVSPHRISLAAGVADALVMLGEARLDVAIVTNQPAVAFGRCTERALEAVRKRIADLVTPCGVRLRGFYYCPHHPLATVPRYATECDCRKPRCGMLLRASGELGAELARSWVVGGILDDVEAGRRAGCRTVLVDTGGETQWVRGPFRSPDVVVRDLAAAALAIVTWPRAVPVGEPNGRLA